MHYETNHLSNTCVKSHRYSLNVISKTQGRMMEKELFGGTKTKGRLNTSG
jgi:hypothetical protein